MRWGHSSGFTPQSCTLDLFSCLWTWENLNNSKYRPEEKDTRRRGLVWGKGAFQFPCGDCPSFPEGPLRHPGGAVWWAGAPAHRVRFCGLHRLGRRETGFRPWGCGLFPETGSSSSARAEGPLGRSPELLAWGQGPGSLSST